MLLIKFSTVWTPLVMPTLKLVQPQFRVGAIVIADNTISSAEGYKEFLQLVRDPDGPYTSTTLPFDGGLEFAIYHGA